MKTAKKVARFILELILTLLLVTYVIITLVSSTVLSKSYILSSLEETDYYNMTYTELQSNFENYIQQSGLDEDILNDIVTKDKIESDTKIIISNIYDSLNEEISTQEIKNNIEKNINKSIDRNNLNKEANEAIDEFIERICDEYKSTILNSKYEQEINSSYNKITKYTKLFKRIIVIAIGIGTIALILLNLKRNYKISTNIGTIFLSSGIILTIINIYINTKIKIQYLSVFNEQLSNVIRNILTNIISNILKYGIIFIILGVVLIITSNILHNITKYKNIMNKESEEN